MHLNVLVVQHQQEPCQLQVAFARLNFTMMGVLSTVSHAIIPVRHAQTALVAHLVIRIISESSTLQHSFVAVWQNTMMME